jgi:hypothetical protein
MVSVPLPICPSGSFDIGVASVGIWCNAWGDLRLGTNFQEETTVHVGQLVGIGAGVSGQFGLGLCVSVWGEVKAELDAEGEYRTDGAWYVWGKQSFTVNGGASYGVGVDDVCLDKSKSYSIGLAGEAQLGHNWNTNTGSFLKVYFQ